MNRTLILLAVITGALRRTVPLLPKVFWLSLRFIDKSEIRDAIEWLIDAIGEMTDHW